MLVQYQLFYEFLYIFFPDPVYGPNPTFGSTCSRDGYQSYFEDCYKLVLEPRVYSDAKDMCEAEGAYLASIHDGYNEAFVETVMLKNGLPNVWIGLQKDVSCSMSFVCGGVKWCGTCLVCGRT